MQKLRFTSDNGDEFYHVLHKRVYQVLASSQTNRYANWLMYFKTVIYFLLFFSAYALVLLSQNLWGFYASYLLMGVSVLLIGFNISHDAAHQVIFRNKKWNDWLYFISFTLQGNNAYIWKKYHNESHHIYTNVHHSDIDVLENPMLRMTDNQAWKPWHRYQHLYAPFLYLFYSLNWFFVRDMLLIFRKSSRTISLGTLPRSEVIILMISKVFYIAYMIALPVFFLNFAWYHVILAFVFNHFLISWIFCGVLGCSHLTDQVIHPESENGTLPMSWAMLQMQTSLDYASDSRLANWLLGGFNAHTLHHLFPNICHIHYLKMVPVLRQTAREFGIEYHETSYFQALASHFRFLKKMGKPDNKIPVA
jgi:linoleoyl-CoA desaturase